MCGPSGAGKSTLITKLMKEHPDDFGFSVSHTTRPPRLGEVDGVAYHFVKRDFILQGRDEGEFLETAEVSTTVIS